MSDGTRTVDRRVDEPREIHTIEFMFDPPDSEKEQKLIDLAKKLGGIEYHQDSANVGPGSPGESA